MNGLDISVSNTPAGIPTSVADAAGFEDMAHARAVIMRMASDERNSAVVDRIRNNYAIQEFTKQDLEARAKTFRASGNAIVPNKATGLSSFGHMHKAINDWNAAMGSGLTEHIMAKVCGVSFQSPAISKAEVDQLLSYVRTKYANSDVQTNSP